MVNTGLSKDDFTNEAGIFWWLSHNWNDTTKKGLDWNKFWWEYYNKIPSWSQHALCFMKCTFQGEQLPTYPPYYKIFELKFNHFLYTILSGIFGESIFGKNIELNENKSQTFGSFR